MLLSLWRFSLFSFWWLFLLLSIVPCGCSEAVNELLFTEIVVSRRDIPAYVALQNLVWYLFTQLTPDPSHPRTFRALARNLFVCIGTIQESLFSALHGGSCRRCGFKNASCLCDVVFRFKLGAFETYPVNTIRGSNVKRFRHWLRGSPILDHRAKFRETGNSFLIPLLFHSNLMKIIIFCAILDLGCTWYEFGLASFFKTWLENSEVQDFRMASMVYGWFNILNHASYIGETSLGLAGRFRSHIKAILSMHVDSGLNKQAQYLHEKIIEQGFRWFVMMPIFIWNRLVPKIARLEREALLVWVRQPSLNVAGTAHSSKKPNYGQEEYATPRKKRFRLVKRLRDLEKKNWTRTMIALDRASKLRYKKLELQQRNRTFALMARIARRPLQVGPGFLDLKVVNKLLMLGRWKLASMVRLANSCLHGPTRAIFLNNFVKIIRHRNDVHYGRWVQSSPIYSVPKFQFLVRGCLQRWLSTLAKRGFVLFLRVRISPCAGPKLIEMFDNSKKWCKKEYHQCVCSCRTMFATPFQKLEGCVFFPFSLFLRFLVGDLPDAWNVRTRLVPNWDDLMNEFGLKAQTLMDSVHKKFVKINSDAYFPTLSFGSPHWASIWSSATGNLHCAALESRFDSLFALLKNYVVTPIDKIRGEAMVICPMRWANAVSSLAVDYFAVTPSDYAQLTARLFRLGDNIPKLVYSRLRDSSRHEFGFLRVWPKGKSLKSFPLLWSEVSWRPLVAYSRHHWRFTLSYLARYCTFIVRHYKLGFGLSDPWEMLLRVASFNDAWLEGSKIAGDIALEWDSMDIEEFFTRMPREKVRQVLRKWTARLIADYPRLRFFCVAKQRCVESLPVLPVSAGGRTRRSRLVRKCFLSRSLTRFEIGMELSSIPSLLAFDFEADVVHVLGRAMRASSGLNIGSPLAATGASMVASDSEYCFLESLSPRIRANLSKMSMCCRWQDDVLQFRFSRSRFQPEFLALETMLGEFFYGSTLRLKRVPEPHGFGYEFYVFGEHFLGIQQINKFARVEALKWIDNRSSLQLNVGQGFGQRRTRKAEIKGYITSILDRSNCVQQNLLLALIRLTAEFRLRGMPETDVISSLREVLPQARFVLPSDWSTIYRYDLPTLRDFCLAYDLSRHQRSLAMSAAQQPRWIASGWSPDS